MISLFKFYVAIFSIFYFAFFYIFKPFSPVFGTSIVSVIRNDTIWVGADSKISHTDNIPVTFEVCKILKFDNFVFAHTGFFGETNTKFYIDDTIKSVLTGVASQQAIIDTFVNTVKPIINYFGNVAFKTARTKYSLGDTIKSINMCNLFAFVVDSPIVYNITFNTYIVDSITVVTDVIIDSTSVEFIFMGKHDHMLPVFGYFFKRFDFDSIDIPQLIDSAITYESTFYPDIIAPPIDIIRLTKNDIVWIKHRAVCN